MTYVTALMFLALVVPATATLSTDSSMSLKERPVMKIVRMLEDMQGELQAELEDDKDVHEKMTCWCTTNDQEKTQAIELGKQKSAELESTIGEMEGKTGELKAKRKATMDEMYANQKGLGDANSLRMKESKEFRKNEADLLDAIASAKNAIVVLSKHNPELAQVKSAVQLLQKARVPELVLTRGTVGRFHAQALKEFLKNVEDARGSSSFLAIPGMQSYAPQSGQIFGILKQMKSDFDDDLAEAQKAEEKSQADFNELQATKQSEIAASQKLASDLDADLADTGETHVQSTKEQEDTDEQVAMDTEFLAKLKEKCANFQAEFDRRVKSRLSEIAAVEDTIGILNSDESFDNFGKTTFLQVATSQETRMRQRAVSVLQRAAGRAGSPQLALLAASVQLDAFTKVKAEIDKMVEELNKQQKDEVAKRDWCIKEKNENKGDTKAAYDKWTSLQAKIADLTKTIETLTNDVDSSKAAIAEMQKQMKRASEVREGENAEYQTTVNDQRMTQIILQKALDRMRQVYELIQQRGAPHIATSGTHTDPGSGPAKLKKMESNAGGSRVLRMLEEVLADSKKTEDEAIEAEEDGQTAYEQFMKGSNKSMKKHMESINNMSEANAKAKESLSMAKADFKMVMSQLEALNNELKDLNESCNYLLDNFDARQEARAAEVDALREAKNILSGMK